MCSSTGWHSLEGTVSVANMHSFIPFALGLSKQPILFPDLWRRIEKIVVILTIFYQYDFINYIRTTTMDRLISHTAMPLLLVLTATLVPLRKEWARRRSSRGQRWRHFSKSTTTITFCQPGKILFSLVVHHVLMYSFYDSMPILFMFDTMENYSLATLQGLIRHRGRTIARLIGNAW